MGHQHAVLWREEGLEAAPARRYRNCQMHGGTVDASSWIAGHQTWPGCANNSGRRQVAVSDVSAVSDGSRAAPVPCRPPQPAVGIGIHVRIDLAGLAVRGLRDRRVCAAYRRLASQSSA